MRDEDKTKKQLIEELEKLRQELHLYETIVEKMPVALTVWELEDLNDPGSFRLIACNPQIEKATGAAYREFVGTTVRETFPSSLETEGPHIYAEAVRSRQVRELPDLRFPGDEQTAAGVYTVTVVPLGGRIAAMFCENITERKRAEEALRESEERYRSLFDRVPVGLYRTTPAGQILDANPALVQMLGYPDRESLLAISATDLYVDPEDRGQEQTLLEREGVVREFETQLRQRDGTVICVKDTVRAVRNAEGRVLCYEGSLEDITKRKRAEETLRESEERFRMVLESSMDNLYRRNLETDTYDYMSPAVERISGYSTEELLSMPLESVVSKMHPDDIDRVNRVMEESMTGDRASYLLEYRFRHKDGQYRWLSDLFTVVRGAQGHPLYLVGNVRDITERKRAEEALRASETEKKAILNAMSDMVLFQNTDLSIRWGNEAARRSVGKTQQEVVGCYCYELWHGRSEPCEGCPVLRALETGSHADGIMMTPDGRWWEITGEPVRDRDGKTVGAIEIAHDITKRKRTEEALRDSQDMLQTVLDSIPSAVFWKDRDSIYLGGNRTWLEAAGLQSSEEVVGKSDYDLPWGKKQADSFREDDRRVMGSGIPEYDILEPYLRADGTHAWAKTNKVPLRNTEGKVVGVLGTYEDITERKQAEGELRRHLERVEALREIDRAITSTLDLTEVLDIILGELKRVIPYHSASIFLLSDDTAKLTAGRGFPDMERALQVSFPVQEDALTREVLWEKRPLILADAQADKRFLARGGTEYVRSWIGVPLIAKGEAIGFLTIDHREPGVYSEESAEIAEGFANQAALAIENARLYEETQRELAERERAEEELQQSFEKLRKAFEGTITVLVSAVEMRDPYTAGHQRRVTQLACAIAKEMGLPEEQIEGIRMAGLIHDLGKINVPAEILSKPSRLTDLEFGLIKMHPRTGHDVLESIEFPWPVAQMVLQHHERMDGSGYPQGLSGEEIILEARILGVADVVEAMASHRPYRSARGIDEALEEISQNRDTLYDPKVVDACLKLFTEKGFEFE